MMRKSLLHCLIIAAIGIGTSGSALADDDVTDGREALERLAEFHPTAVLCDLQLRAGENGLDVVEQLRGRRGGVLACAFITGESTRAVIDSVRARGYPIAFKPMKPAKLRALVEHLSQYR